MFFSPTFPTFFIFLACVIILDTYICVPTRKRILGTLIKNNKSIGIKELATMANVSIGTIDRVIHDRPGVSKKTKEKVAKLIKEVGYNPNPIARRLAGFNKVHRIAVVIPQENKQNPYWKDHSAGVERALEMVGQFGIEIEIISFNQRKEETFIQVLTELSEDDSYDAFVLAPLFLEPSENFVLSCKQQKKDVVLIDTNITDSPKLSFIGQDAYQSGYIAGKLTSFKLKADETAFVCHITRASKLAQNFRKREKGFRDYFEQETNIPQSCIKSIQLKGENIEEIRSEFKEIVQQEKNLKTIFIPSTRSFMCIPELDEKKNGNVFVLGYDLVEGNMDLLKKGTIDVLIGQAPETQCYKAIVFLYEKIIAGKTVSKHINTPIDIILKENLDYYLTETKSLF